MIKDILCKVEGIIFGLTIAYAGLATAAVYIQWDEKTKLKEEVKHLNSIIDVQEGKYDFNRKN